LWDGDPVGSNQRLKLVVASYPIRMQHLVISVPSGVYMWTVISAATNITNSAQGVGFVIMISQNSLITKWPDIFKIDTQQKLINVHVLNMYVISFKKHPHGIASTMKSQNINCKCFDRIRTQHSEVKKKMM
jgi:hypothetical protein